MAAWDPMLEQGPVLSQWVVELDPEHPNPTMRYAPRDTYQDIAISRAIDMLGERDMFVGDVIQTLRMQLQKTPDWKFFYYIDVYTPKDPRDRVRMYRMYIHFRRVL